MGLILLVIILVTITLTDEEYYIIRMLFDRIDKQQKRIPRKKKWIKQDGLMINIETGSILDITSNKFVIDRQPNLRALAVQMSISQQLPLDNFDAPDGVQTMI